MISYIQLFEILFISAFISYLSTPFIRMIAFKLDYIDHPENNKVHAHPTPLLGGVAIFTAFLITVIANYQIVANLPIIPILSGTFILLIIGLIDDRMGMMPNFKLLGQFLAAMIVIKAGLRIQFLHNYYLNVIVTYIWIVGMTNAFNLLDNMNGLSAGIAAIAAIFFSIISYMNGQIFLSAICLALAGSALGFLKHNFPKANIFMGDAGSLILGYLLAVIAIIGSWKTYILTTSLAIPILVLGYPIFDTILVSAMRVLERRSIFQGGKDHSSHRLALLGFKRYKTVLIVYVICIFLGSAAIVITNSNGKIGMAVGCIAFLSMLAFGVRLSFVDSRRFGRKKMTDEQG